MTTSFTFSVLGAAYLVMLFVPNLLWAKLRNTQSASKKESALLLALERVGQIATTTAAVVAPRAGAPGIARLSCLAVSLMAMGLYELSWLRYFRSNRSDANMYAGLGPVPLPLAVLPVLGFLLLAVYEVHLLLLASVIVLGIGHIGIHWSHAHDAY